MGVSLLEKNWFYHDKKVELKYHKGTPIEMLTFF